MHPNQAQPARTAVSRRGPRHVPVVFHYERRGRKSTRATTGPGPQFDPDPSRIARDHTRDGDPQLLPPGVRLRRPLRARGGFTLDERVASYAAAGRGRGVKTTLTGRQRRRVAHKARLTGQQRATL